MDILERPQSQEKTIEEKKAIQKVVIKAGIQRSFDSILKNFDENFKLVWQNRQLTPQQVFDAFGVEAVQLFQLAGAIQQMMNTLKPGCLPQTPPKPFTINEDGTVTVSE
jgi:hypothetical protein